MLGIRTSRAPLRVTGVTRDPRLLDAALVVTTLVTNIGGVLMVALHNGEFGLPPPPGLLLLMIGPGLLWRRRRFPTLVLVGCLIVTWMYVLSGLPEGPVYGPLIVALVSGLTQGARAAAYTVVVGTLLTSLTLAVLPGVEGTSLASTAGLTAWLAFLLALGETLRHRTALREARREHLLMSLDAHADQIRREAAEQRLGLARDLHDVLGHQLAVINIQAKAGLQLHTSGQPGVTDALEAVAETSSQALDDVQAFLNSLHELGETTAAHAPASSLADLDTLLAPSRAAGLDVIVDTTGTPRRLPVPQDLVASRVVTEALTNVLRHAGLPRTWLRVDYRADRVTVSVDNAAPDAGWARRPGSGRGIKGMQQRLAAYGGTLTAGPTDEYAWSLKAVLPLSQAHL